MQLLFPSGLAYGVIKMDPSSMVKDLGLDDPDTLAAVAAMTPKKYLVYLEHVSRFPSPPAHLHSLAPASGHSSAPKSMVSLLHKPHWILSACRGQGEGPA